MIHNVILCSDWSKKHFPDNSANKFTNVLQGNFNFSSGNWSVALTDIVYTPDAWANVREGYNDFQIGMTGYAKMGLVPRTIYGVEPSFEVKNNEYRVMAGWASAGNGSNCNYVQYRSSEWISGKPWDIKTQKQDVIPIFRSLNPSTRYWQQDACYKFALNVMVPGVVKADTWEFETGYIPPKYYDSFDEFATAFDFALHNTILRLFERTTATTEVLRIEKFTKESHHSKYELIGALSHIIGTRSFNANNELDWEQILTGYEPMESVSDPVEEFILHTERDKLIKIHGKEPLTDTHVKMKDKYDVWVSLGKFKQTESDDLVSVSAVEKFAKETSFGLKINRHMQHQLGFTLHPQYDMGWIPWYERTKEIEATATPMVFWYGYLPPDMKRNTMKSLCVHCNIIEGSYVGNKKLQLLRMLPVNVFTHLIASESFNTLQYRHVNKNNVNTINIWITETPHGPPITLRSMIYVKLQFTIHG